MQHIDPTITGAADALRKSIAYKRDALVGRQRSKYDANRQLLIEQLGEQYRDVYAIQLETE